MNIWVRIKQLSIKQLLQLAFLFAQKPHYIAPTMRATKETMKICDRMFGSAHHKSTKSNAFRHALWNYLICQKVLKITKIDQKAVNWTEKVTKTYEKVTNNTILDEAMDLHNNEIGRSAFLANNALKIEEIIAFFTKMMAKAVKIEQIEQIDSVENQLVYIIE